jgi:hypothetical protein
MAEAQRKLVLAVLGERLSVCQLDADAEAPDWAGLGSFVSITRTPEELSIVCPTEVVPAGVSQSRGWRVLQVEGPFDFSETGVLASIAGPLAEAGISMLAICTYDTDYVLVKAADLSDAIAALRRAGHDVRGERAPAG